MAFAGLPELADGHHIPGVTQCSACLSVHVAVRLDDANLARLNLLANDGSGQAVVE